MSGYTGTTSEQNALLSEDAFRNLLGALQAPKIQASKIENEPRGRGHYAMVYHGTALVQSRRVQVALKVFHKSNTRVGLERLTRNIIRETRVWSQLRHPNILPLLGVCPEIESRRIWLVSPWIENGNLSEYLNNNPRADCVGLCRGIVRGVHYLHSVDVLHEDIRATNVLVDANEVPLLADFGLSRFVEELPAAGDATTGLYQGSLRWMAPERIQPTTFGMAAGAAQSAASDVYSVGMTMYEIFTRKMPFHQKRDIELVQTIVRGVRPDHPGNVAIMRGMNPRLWEFMWDTWDHDRAKRPQLEVALQTVLFDPETPKSTTSQLKGVTRNAYSRKTWVEIDLAPSEPVYELENWSGGQWTDSHGVAHSHGGTGLYLGRTRSGEKGLFPGYLIHLEDQSTAHGVAHEPRVPDAPSMRPRLVQRATEPIQAPDPYDVARVKVGMPRTLTVPGLAPMYVPQPSAPPSSSRQYYQDPSDFNTRPRTPPWEARDGDYRTGRPVDPHPQSHPYRGYASHPDESEDDDDEDDNEFYSSSSGGHQHPSHHAQPTANTGYYAQQQHAPPAYPPPHLDTRTQYPQDVAQPRNPDPRTHAYQDPRPRQVPSIASGYISRPAPLTAINGLIAQPPALPSKHPTLPTPPLSAGVSNQYQTTTAGPAPNPNYPYTAARAPQPPDGRGPLPPAPYYPPATRSDPPGTTYIPQANLPQRSDTMPASTQAGQYQTRQPLQGQGRPGSYPSQHAAPPQPVVSQPGYGPPRPQLTTSGTRQPQNPVRQQTQAERDHLEQVTNYMGAMNIQPPQRPGQPGPAYWPPQPR